MLHRTGRDVLRGMAGVRDAFDRLNLGDVGMLHESDRRAVTHLEEAVERVVDPVHPVERDQFHPDDFGEVLDLLLDVLGADCEMMYSVGQTHDATSVRSVSLSCATKGAVSETLQGSPDGSSFLGGAIAWRAAYLMQRKIRNQEFGPSPDASKTLR